MNRTVLPGPRRGSVTVPASKSQAHRLLICAALGARETLIRCDGISGDIAATVRCLNALGAEIRETETGLLVRPRGQGSAEAILPCGESGSTLRFLIPVLGTLGQKGTFRMEGKLPARPLGPLAEVCRAGGMELRQEGTLLRCGGQLRPGDYEIPGNVSSQYISGLLMALPLLPGESRLHVTGKVESADYIAMTEEALHMSGVRWEKTGWEYRIPGGQRPSLPPEVTVERDWSSAAFFLVLGALSPAGITLPGLNGASRQGDKRILQILREFGAEVREEPSGVTVCRRSLRGVTVDAAQIPDLVPVLSVAAAAAEGETRILGAARLRLKESDRLVTTAAMLRALGAEVQEREDGLVIRGKPKLRGGTADAAGDHRIAMSAAVAAAASEKSVTILGAECAAKSYPRFWKDLDSLEVTI
ncbi:MAG: 3-phosphoshikimate 1-carboxyvinyltransferase [Oscillospiraceae bacterium]|nr:3-phosphoshikimate 1-carboxyvinyltransferase [Oscillospiraceae bacterium]